MMIILTGFLHRKCITQIFEVFLSVSSDLLLTINKLKQTEVLSYTSLLLKGF